MTKKYLLIRVTSTVLPSLPAPYPSAFASAVVAGVTNRNRRRGRVSPANGFCPPPSLIAKSTGRDLWRQRAGAEGDTDGERGQPLSRAGGGGRRARWFTSRTVSLGGEGELRGRLLAREAGPRLSSVLALRAWRPWRLAWTWRRAARRMRRRRGPGLRRVNWSSTSGWARAEVPKVTTVPGAQRPRRASGCGTRESGFCSRASVSLT